MLAQSSLLESLHSETVSKHLLCAWCDDRGLCCGYLPKKCLLMISMQASTLIQWSPPLGSTWLPAMPIILTTLLFLLVCLEPVLTTAPQRAHDSGLANQNILPAGQSDQFRDGYKTIWPKNPGPGLSLKLLWRAGKEIFYFMRSGAWICQGLPLEEDQPEREANPGESRAERKRRSRSDENV